MSHKRSRSRVSNHEAAPKPRERIWGKKDTGEPPRAITGTKSKPIPDPPKKKENVSDSER